MGGKGCACKITQAITVLHGILNLAFHYWSSYESTFVSKMCS
jgi:hypothetical protein